jgi:Uma2 family endonuclease
MNQPINKPMRGRGAGQPAWDVALLFPEQGAWSEEEYLDLNSNRLVEFTDGAIEVLPMPTTSHQLILCYLFRLLEAFVSPRNLGTALLAALPVQLRPGKYREPDIVFMLAQHAARIGESFWEGADLVMEVVSRNMKDRHRDLVTKRREYARAGIAEYWIVDPRQERILVLRLAGTRYVVHGTFSKGSVATSPLLPGFSVDVTEALSQQVPAAKRSTKRRKES